ncbi:MAG: glycosyltransferase family 2 protein [Anaerolineae bacterium]
MPSVVLLILTWNGKQDTLECLDSLDKLEYPGFWVLVVDNASTDGTVAAVRERFPEVKLLVNERNLGYAGGNNVGIRAALETDVDYVFILNNDIVFEDADCLLRLVEAAEVHPTGGLFGPKTYRYGEDNLLDFIGGTYSMYTGLAPSVGVDEYDRGQYETMRVYPFVNGHAVLVKRAVFETVGLFDETYFGYYEETDFCHRARMAGFDSIYVPQARIWHKVSRAPMGELREYLMYRNQILFVRKHATRLEKVVFSLHYALLQMPRFVAGNVLRGRWRRLRNYVRAVGWNLGVCGDGDLLVGVGGGE